ncbi:MAG: GNAT family N-acetyltransferase [Firmicutes bacterium]|nr:GNAT family N-acetyltransferase [Bacillota bacterium]
MINLDSEAEGLVLSGEWELAIPFSMRAFDGCKPDEIKIDVFPIYEGAAREFLYRFGSVPFSDAALEFIARTVGGDMKSRGFTEDSEETATPNILFTIKSQENVKRNVILPSTVRLDLTDVSGLCNLTSYDTALYREMGIDAFVTVTDGKIVSIAAKNPDDSSDFGDFDRPVFEIGVETDENYRRRGFAASNIAAIAYNALSCRKGYVTYETHADNIPAVRAATSAGFSRYGMSYYYVMTRNLL